MFEDLLPGISSYDLISVVIVVFLSEFLKKLMPKKLTSEKKVLSGLYFLFPLLLSLAVTLVEYIAGVKTEWKVLIHDSLRLFGMSVLLYEAVVKRIFPKQGDNNDKVDNSANSNNSSSDLAASSDDKESEVAKGEVSETARRD